MLGDTTNSRRKTCRGSCGQNSCLPGRSVHDLVPKSAEIVTRGDARGGRNPSGARAKPSRAWPRQGSSGTAAASCGRRTPPANTAWLRERIGEAVEVVVTSILADKAADAMLGTRQRSRRASSATASEQSARASAEQLATRAAPHFARVEIRADPHRALVHARQSSTGLILVTGSLYLLANLARAEEQGVR